MAKRSRRPRRTVWKGRVGLKIGPASGASRAARAHPDRDHGGHRDHTERGVEDVSVLPSNVSLLSRTEQR